MMKINKWLLGMAALFASNVYTQAQERILPLQEAITLGLAHSNSLQISRSKIDEAQAMVLEAKNRQLPDFKISGSYLRMTGANVNIKVLSEGSAGNAPKVNQAVYGSANLSWPIFSGGRIKYGIESAKYLLEAAKLTTANDKDAVAYNITQAYTNLFKAGRIITVIQENLAASQQRDSQYIRLENNGVIPRNDRLKAQLQTSQIELQLIEAESNYRVANENMNLLLGLPENTKLVIDSSFINNKLDTREFLYYENAALQNRNDAQAAVYRQKAAALGIKSAKAENLPSLALTGGYMAADVPKVLTITNAINVGLGVQYNLANIWKKNSDLKKAEAQQRESIASVNLLQENIRLQVNRDYEDAVVAQRKIEVYQTSLAQAEENYHIVKNKYDNGLATITDVLDANAALYAAQINIANAKADAALNYQKLLQTAGLINQP